MLALLVVFYILTVLSVSSDDKFTTNQFEARDRRHATVMVALLVRNKAHTLPYFLNYLERLDYPKDRMALWIRADHNIDNSLAILAKWIQHTGSAYNWIDYQKFNNGIGYTNEEGPCDWTYQRFHNVINLRQEALDAARRVWADYLFFTDSDNILVNEKVLLDLISQQK
ncbi:hypothetical protein LSH36_790g01064 [Paralvinella palmiformis]|uniref:Uncharacterized protein n=1 Tax=Paralvinella palmiformis TaxID=53620 RepID=A0AAD9J137_9ANNE|nr:hypothetical protein LSH36_790g01064 [Paralvinella palmiformis]